MEATNENVKRVTKRKGKGDVTVTAASDVVAARTIVTGRETVAIDDLTPNDQQHRKHFDPVRMAELTESIRRLGVQSPPWVRQVVNPHDADEGPVPGFEIIAGERRWRAARAAGLTHIVVDVKVYEDGGLIDDEMALELAIVENNQRADPHPLEEADAFIMLRNRYMRTAEQIAAVIRRSPAYVYERLALGELGEKGRAAMWEGKIGLAVAHALSRITHPKVQDEAVKDLTAHIAEGEQVTARVARDVITLKFMLRIADAPFATSDETLLPRAGACGNCPKRSGNQGVLFEQGLGRADLCTDRVCWAEKRKESDKRVIAEAKANGRAVLTREESTKLFPYNGRFQSGSWIALSESDYALTAGKPWRDVLGEKRLGDIEVAYAQGPDGLVEIAKRSEVLAVVKKTPAKTDTAGIKELRQKKAAAKRDEQATSGEEDGHSKYAIERRAKQLALAKLAAEVERGEHSADRATEISRAVVIGVAMTAVEFCDLDDLSTVLRRRGVKSGESGEGQSPKDLKETILREMPELTIAQLRGLLVELVAYTSESFDAEARLLAIAEIDPGDFHAPARAELEAERQARKATKKSGKKAKSDEDEDGDADE